MALVALYTGQRRADVIGLCENQIREGVWSIEQGKTGNSVTLPLHPVVLAIIEEERAARRKAQVVAPALPLLTNSRGNPWGPGFGASWTKGLIRICLRPERTDEMVEEIVTAAGMLAERRVGALIAIERDIGLRTYVDSGIYLDARVTYDLLVSVFQSESPLHDGAVIIQEDRLAAASCFLPLTVNAQSTNLGTRHRAAIGLTEESDAVALIISEETGIVSLVRDGEIESGLDSKQLTNRLDSAMHTRRSRRRSFSQKAV